MCILLHSDPFPPPTHATPPHSLPPRNGHGAPLAATAAPAPATAKAKEEKEGAAAALFKAQDVVEVIPDTRPGVNRLGRVARITKVCACLCACLVVGG